MKRYSTIELCAALIGLVFIIVGLASIIHPTEMIFLPHRGRGMMGPVKPVPISKEDAVIYGLMSVLLGIGVCFIALYRGRK
ncbi:MAG TPA: hypothetical protein VK742_19455 [Candidatus Sulfotelmatobacter sp.]|nr:hypothetical protein [Candidatus Sulfotelmatobacter sp.]